MDYGTMLCESFAYAKDAVIGKWKQWLLLIVATILLCLPLLGYTVKVLRGERPAPEVMGWGTLFIDGIKYLVISLIYAIPALIILFVTIGSGVIAAAASNPAASMNLLGGGILPGLLIFVVVAFICSLYGTIGLIRFARTGGVGEGFNFAAIQETIGKIGWGTYIVALIIMGIIQVIIAVVFSAITSAIMPIGLLIELVFLAPVTLFEARYLSLLYDAAGTA
jgi:hypothetical protein